VLPGKKYSLVEILRIGGRWMWLLIVLVALTAALAARVSRYLPVRYRSETMIMLVPQRVPDSYVKSAAATSVEDRLATLKEQILSRSRLERIILDLRLYPLERRRLPMEEVVQRMRDDIGVKTTGKESAFQLSYVSGHANTAQKVTERLASLFIEESLRDRANAAEDTGQFLESQLQDARRRLIEQEKKLEEYRRRYSGQLPTQAATNLQAMQNAQQQLQSLQEASDRARERRLLVERQIADLQTGDPVVIAPSTAAVPGDPTPESTAQQLASARGRLDLLLTRVRPTHPDVRSLQRSIRDLETKQQRERLEARADDPADRPMSPAEVLRQKRLRDVNAQLGDLDRELAEKQQQENRLRGVIADYQAKLEVVPTRESELVELTRDYTTLQATYQSLLAKREESKLAANLERRNIGEQFRVLDPARIPERPFSPNRLLIVLGAAGGGLVLGLLLVVLFEYRDATFTRDDEVARLCKLPVLAMVPVMMADDQRRRARRWFILVRVSAIVAALALAAALVGRSPL
jgi:polysaccharide chain length determinant protein (PEP-CTERM system associated)